MSQQSQYRILSLDGGGVRGIIPALWLQHLEQRLGYPLRNYFDLIAGSSTGAIIACAISAGIPTSRIVQFYREESAEVFPAPASRLWNRVLRTLSEGVSAPRYSDEGLARVLQRVFGNTRFAELTVKPTLVTSYNTLNREAVVFKNTKPLHANLPVWEICKASASAPSFFPAHVMQIGEQKVPLVDGGVVANNPTACAIAEGVRINATISNSNRIDLSNFIVASFGTGASTRPISIAESQEWGALEWAIPIVDVLFDGSADAVDYIASYLLADEHYFRFQTPLTTAYDDLDRADPINLNALTELATTYLAQDGKAQLDRLADLLSTPITSTPNSV